MNQTRKAMRAITITPPTTPPTMGPMGVLCVVLEPIDAPEVEEDVGITTFVEVIVAGESVVDVSVDEVRVNV